MVAEQLGFGWDEAPAPRTAGGAPPPRARNLARRLQKLAEQHVYLGTSSWKYPGWIGQVYDAGDYLQGKRFSQKRFNDQCLSHYARIFPTVCGDFAFYQFPSTATWKRTFDQLPAGYKFSLKVPEDITVERFPNLPRYGRRAGTSNGHFMDSALLRERLLTPLEPYRDKLGVLIFQFGTIHEGPMSQAPNFVAGLREMLAELPTGRYAFAVEVRNAQFLKEPAYFDCLRDHNTAHCLNSWTRMPSITDQLRLPGVLTATHVVARLLLRPGRSYQQAVEQFSPYETVQDAYPEGRQALSELIEQCLSGPHALFAFVNNRFEGNAIQTIEAVV